MRHPDIKTPSCQRPDSPSAWLLSRQYHRYLTALLRSRQGRVLLQTVFDVGAEPNIRALPNALHYRIYRRLPELRYGADYPDSALNRQYHLQRRLWLQTGQTKKPLPDHRHLRQPSCRARRHPKRLSQATESQYLWLAWQLHQVWQQRPVIRVLAAVLLQRR